MKSGKLLIATAIGLCLALPALSFAADGAATYKAKCAMCHGAEGQGKVGPALKGTSQERRPDHRFYHHRGRQPRRLRTRNR